MSAISYGRYRTMVPGVCAFIIGETADEVWESLTYGLFGDAVVAAACVSLSSSSVVVQLVDQN